MGTSPPCSLMASPLPSLPYKGPGQVPVWPHQDLLPGGPGSLPGEASGRQVPGSHHHDPEDRAGLAAEGEVLQVEGGDLDAAEVLPRTPGPQVSHAGAPLGSGLRVSGRGLGPALFAGRPLLASVLREVPAGPGLHPDFFPAAGPPSSMPLPPEGVGLVLRSPAPPPRPSHSPHPPA